MKPPHREKLHEVLPKLPPAFADRLLAAVRRYAPQLLTDEHAHGHGPEHARGPCADAESTRDLGDHRHDAIPPGPHRGER